MARRSVIFHTKDISETSTPGADSGNTALRNNNNNKRISSDIYSIQQILSATKTANSKASLQMHSSSENKDSGFEDDDDMSEVYDNFSSANRVSSSDNCTSSVETDNRRNASRDEQQRQRQRRREEMSPNNNSNNLLKDLSQLPPLITDEHLKHLKFYDPNSDDFKQRFEGSVLSALRDPQIQYLLTLYSFIDEDLLKQTLTKFLNGSSLDNSTLNAAENYLKNPSLNKSLNNKSSRKPRNELIDFLTIQKQQISNQSKNHSSNTNNMIQLYGLTPSLLDDLSNDSSSPSKYSKDTSLSEKQCEYCQKTFTNKHSLSRHLRTHEGTRTHKCSKCARSFYDQPSYLRHVRSHNGDKKHKCEQCSMAFNKRSALEVHKRTHTGERPFVCEHCGKGFSISGNLHRHVLIHTGHRPYKCGKCPRAFNNPSHLARHINSFHT